MQHPLNAVNFFNTRLTIGIKHALYELTALGGTCSLDPERGRRIRRGIRRIKRRRRVGVSGKTRWTLKRSERKWRKVL